MEEIKIPGNDFINNNPMKKKENIDKLKERLREYNPLDTDIVRDKNSKRMIEQNTSENNPMKKQENKDALSKRVSGKNNVNFKYTKEMINKIIELRKSGMSQLDIAKQTGYSKTKVGEVCKKNNI